MTTEDTMRDKVQYWMRRCTGAEARNARMTAELAEAEEQKTKVAHMLTGVLCSKCRARLAGGGQ